MELVVRLFEEDGTFENQKNLIKDIANIELRPSFTEAEIIENAKDAHYIICGYEQITAHVLDNLPNLKMVVFQSIGVNGINMSDAISRNLPVANISQYCVPEVADYVLACILSDNRKLVQFNHSVKVNKNWVYDEYIGMRRLSNQTVGLLGFGNIPRLVREKLRSYGCDVIAYDPFVSEEVFSELGVRKGSIEEVFAQADFISAHLPLNDATANIINWDLLSQTTKSPAFINSARGGVVDEGALIKAMDEGFISYSYLDVLKSEYPDLDKEPLVLHDKTLLTPHSAFYSLDSMAQAGTDAVMNVINYIKKDFTKVDIVNRRDITLEGEK